MHAQKYWFNHSTQTAEKEQPCVIHQLHFPGLLLCFICVVGVVKTWLCILCSTHSSSLSRSLFCWGTPLLFLWANHSLDVSHSQHTPLLALPLSLPLLLPCSLLCFFIPSSEPSHTHSLLGSTKQCFKVRMKKTSSLCVNVCVNSWMLQ